MAAIESPLLPSLARASAGELASLSLQTLREKLWYAGHRRFATNQDITAAVEAGELVQVHPGPNLMPIGRLRNPELHNVFPPYLLPESRFVLQSIGQQWRRELGEAGKALPNVRLAVTSLVRSAETEAALVANPYKLAVADSTHGVAAAFDIDASGYYVFGRNGLASVAHPNRDVEIVGRIGRSLREGVSTPYENAPTTAIYDPTVAEALLEITGFLHRAGIINAIVEYEGTANQCVHIAPNPGALWSLDGEH